MIFVASLAEARSQRTHFVSPAGLDTWVSRLFPSSAETPERPMASFVEQTAHTVILPHFHEVNQFQVLVEGHGSLGKHAIQPWTVHYTNGFTGYGPLRAAATGMGFFTLRNRFDAGGARFFPAGQSFMQPAPKRHHIMGPLVLSSTEALHSRQSQTCDTVLALEDDGLAAWFLRLGPGMHTQAPEPAHGGGQYLLVAAGTLLHDGLTLPRLSCMYVSADTASWTLHSGADGLEALILQFPVAEAAAVQPGKTSRRRERASNTAETGEAQAPQQSAGARQSTTANPEHVALVQRGTAAIASWCAAHPGERLHLEKADLTGANLRGANLQGARLQEALLDAADLSEANLQHADLRSASLLEANLTGARLQYASLVRANLAAARLPWARLQRAHLHGAHLQEAHLTEANLQKAYLVSANLVGADLHGAYLERADLQWANLHDANLTGARLHEVNLHESVVGHTTFGHTQLHGARGLDTCRHQAPSTLDIGTLACAGSLPAAFLRGCGCAEALVESLAQLLQERAVPAYIERSLVLPAAYHQAGLSLLTYVGTILRQQHPDIPTHCRVEQFGLRLRLVVETSPEQRQTVEQTLQAYGGAVAELQTPAAWLVAPGQAQQLQQQLDIVATALCLRHDMDLQSEPPDVLLPPGAAERRHVRQLIGNALHDL